MKLSKVLATATASLVLIAATMFASTPASADGCATYRVCGAISCATYQTCCTSFGTSRICTTVLISRQMK